MLDRCQHCATRKAAVHVVYEGKHLTLCFSCYRKVFPRPLSEVKQVTA